MYALPTTLLKTQEKKRLDNLQCTILRYILNIRPAFLSKISNQQIITRAKTHYKRLKKLSATYTERTVTLLGNILRETQDDAMRHAIVDEHGHFRVTEDRKVGRPAFTWLSETAKEAAKRIDLHNFDHRDLNHQRLLQQAAMERKF